MENERQSGNGFWMGFFVGGLAGAVLLYFLGTKEGKKLAEELKGKGGELLDQLGEEIEDLEGKAVEVKEKIGGQAMDKLDEALIKLEEKQDLAREATSNFRKRFFLKNGKKLA